MEETKGSRTLSKKMYYDIEARLNEKFKEEDVDVILSLIKEVMRFDPEKSVYSEKMKKQIQVRRERMKEEGISTYISSGAKASYDKKKGILNRCKNYLCDTQGYEKYEGYCTRCYVHLFPDKPISTRIKTKESAVISYMKDKFPDHPWIYDRKISNGCSRYRPDIFLDCLTHSLIIEVDENQHESYDCECENRRMMAIFEDLGSRPLVMIRFNPDDYMSRSEKHVKSCFVYKNKSGLPSIRNQQRWDSRLDTLGQTIERHLKNIPVQEVTLEHLYYDSYE